MQKTHFSSQSGLGLPIIIVIIAVLAILAGVAVPRFFAPQMASPSDEENAGGAMTDGINGIPLEEEDEMEGTVSEPEQGSTSGTPSSGSGSTAPGTDEPPAASVLNVTIQNFAFSPKTLTIPAGTTVTFTNLDSVGHSATQDGGGFDTGMISQGQSKSIAFSQSGTYAYHCTPHPNMKATIIVE